MEKAEGGARLGGRRVPEGHSGAQERLAGDASEPRPPQQVELMVLCMARRFQGGLSCLHNVKC